MAGAYSTIANDGKYIEPTFYSKIERKNGDILVKTQQKTRTVFSKEVAYILKEILLQPVIGENGTATYCKISGVDVAAKTGTTDENYDRWLCGFTPYYTAVTWYGFDQNESIEFNQRNPAGLIWANVMSRIHTGLNTAKFEKPNAITTITICAETGKKARTGCTHTYTEYFLWFTEPELCNKHTGSESKDKEKTDTKNTVTEIIKGITDDIDEKEPPRNDNTITDTKTENQEKNRTNINNNTNVNNTTKQNNTNSATNSNSNTFNQTNTSQNTSNTTNDIDIDADTNQTNTIDNNYN